MTKAISSTILRKNSKYASLVKEMQEGLIQLNYDIGPDGADGDFGNNTYNAVCQFQLEHGLESDGEFGPQSWTALYEALGFTVANPSYPTASTITNNNNSIVINNFSVGDQIKLKKDAVYTDGKKIPKWVSALTLYVRNINSSNSIAISIFKSGAITGNVEPKYLELVKSSDNNTFIINDNLISNSGTVVSSNSIAFTAKKLIDIALAEVGYKEKASNSSLDDKTANAGAANWTKYARDLAQAGYYNGNKNGYAWCDVFVDWCFYQLTNKDKAKAEYIECQDGDMGAGCAYSAGYYKSNNRWSTYPSLGAQVFFYYSGDINHTGIVTNVTSTTIETVEGNSTDSVGKRTYPIGHSTIAGYGLPRFDEEEKITRMPGVQVKVTAKKLYARSAPSSDSEVLFVVNKNDILTIVKSEGVYGKMADGAWVDLSYTKKYEE